MLLSEHDLLNIWHEEAFSSEQGLIRLPDDSIRVRFVNGVWDVSALSAVSGGNHYCEVKVVLRSCSVVDKESSQNVILVDFVTLVLVVFSLLVLRKRELHFVNNLDLLLVVTDSVCVDSGIIRGLSVVVDVITVSFEEKSILGIV